jgi:hypothetical protein
MTTENALDLVKMYAQPAKSSFGGELDYNIIPSKQFYHLANEIAEKVNMWQDQAITLHKIIYKMMNEEIPTYDMKEGEVIKSIVAEIVNNTKK